MRIKRLRLTNGAMIALFVVISLIWGTMPYPAFSQNQAQQANIPGTQKLVNPDVIIANFETGTNALTEVQQNELHKLYNLMSQNPKLMTILMGTVSDLRINGGCYLDPNDPTYFSTPGNRNRFPNNNAEYQRSADANENNQICQSALALSRAFAVRNWMVENGIAADRIYILNYSTQGLIPGSNFPNQSVLAWTIGSGAQIPCQPCPPNAPCPPCVNGCTPEIIGLPECCTFTIGEVDVINNTRIVKIQIDCSGCKKPKPECSRFNRWPCMSTGEKVLWSSLGAAGLIALILAATVKTESKTSHTSSCAGAGC